MKPTIKDIARRAYVSYASVSRARDRSFGVFICNSNWQRESEREYLSLLAERIVDGVIGFDNIPFAAFPGIQLTTINQPKYAMGKFAAEILLE